MAGAQRGNMKLLQQSPGLAAAFNFPNAMSGMRQPHAEPLRKPWVCSLSSLRTHQIPRRRTVPRLSAGLLVVAYAESE
jgi:hypothetical protein